MRLQLGQKFTAFPLNRNHLYIVNIRCLIKFTAAIYPKYPMYHYHPLSLHPRFGDFETTNPGYVTLLIDSRSFLKTKLTSFELRTVLRMSPKISTTVQMPYVILSPLESDYMPDIQPPHG